MWVGEVVVRVGWKSCVLRLDEAWVWEVNENMDKMREISWQVPNAFEQDGLGSLAMGNLLQIVKGWDCQNPWHPSMSSPRSCR